MRSLSVNKDSVINLEFASISDIKHFPVAGQSFMSRCQETDVFGNARRLCDSSYSSLSIVKYPFTNLDILAKRGPIFSVAGFRKDAVQHTGKTGVHMLAWL